jgi:hypothetical protein
MGKQPRPSRLLVFFGLLLYQCTMWAASATSPSVPTSGSTFGPGDRLILQECTPEFTEAATEKSTDTPASDAPVMATAEAAAAIAAQYSAIAVKKATDGNLGGAQAAAKTAKLAADTAKELAGRSKNEADERYAAAAAASSAAANEAATDSAGGSKKYSAPAKGQIVFATMDYPSGNNSKDKDSLRGRSLNFWVDSQVDANGNIAGHFTLPIHPWYPLTKDYAGTLEKCGSATTGVTLNQRYFVNANSLGSYAVMQTGMSYGAITIPYKLHLTDKSFTAAPTIAAYVGYGLGLTGLA